jgi:allophanate hydrolase subunit 2
LSDVFPTLAAIREQTSRAWSVAVLPGSQASWFDETKFYGQQFTVSNASNRMGLRLDGPRMHKQQGEMVSEPVAPGAIQVTNEGQSILLGVDGQTIGGYPKIAHVIQADLHRLGQMHPGQPLAFRQVSLEQATQSSRAAQAKLREWTARLRLSLDGFSSE